MSDDMTSYCIKFVKNQSYGRPFIWCGEKLVNGICHKHGDNNKLGCGSHKCFDGEKVVCKGNCILST